MVVTCLSSQGKATPASTAPVPAQGLVTLQDQLWIPKDGDGVVKRIKTPCPTLLARGQAPVLEVSGASKAPGPYQGGGAQPD